MLHMWSLGGKCMVQRRWKLAGAKSQVICKVARVGPPKAPDAKDLIVDPFRDAGPKEAKPDYTAIDSNPANQFLLRQFSQRMAAQVGIHSSKEGFDGIVDMSARLNGGQKTPQEIQLMALAILYSCFPEWLLPAYRAMFATPFPEFSNQLNAYVTWLASQWLMGESSVNDIEVDGQVKKGHGVLVKRCRYLDETGCASVCINSCKVPTQEFFRQHMGLPVYLEPNYDDFSCQFHFGVQPPPPSEDPALSTPCFSICPTKKLSKSMDCANVGRDTI